MHSKIEDMTARLPPLRKDLNEAKRDVDEFGLALMTGILSAGDLERARQSLATLAARELEDGTAVRGGGPPENPLACQRVFVLAAKGQIWRDIATNPALIELAHHILGERIVLHAMQAHMVGPSGSMALHTDQTYIRPAVPFPCLATAVIMLDDFTEDNGATRVVPRSHLDPRKPSQSLDDAVPLVGRAGTMAIYGGHLWHGAGSNRSGKIRHGLFVHYSCPWVRQFENYGHDIPTDVLRGFDPTMQALLDVHSIGVGKGLQRPNRGSGDA